MEHENLADLDSERLRAFFTKLTTASPDGRAARLQLASEPMKCRYAEPCPDSPVVTVIGRGHRVVVSPKIVMFAIRSGWKPEVGEAFAATVDGLRACVFLLSEQTAGELATVLLFATPLSDGSCACGLFAGGHPQECLQELIGACQNGDVFMIFAAAGIGDSNSQRHCADTRGTTPCSDRRSGLSEP
ncbi:MAG: hypothetical protein ACYTG0_05115 [Planctomycetota bacterium]|jgi:hypothetical protein